MKYIIFILLLAGCGMPQVQDGKTKLNQLYAVEDELTAEISRLKQNLRDAADDDDIDDLEDEIEDLEDRLRRVKAQERVVERTRYVSKSGSSTSFCNRTEAVRHAIKKALNTTGNHIAYNSASRGTGDPIERCGQVSSYLLAKVTTLDLGSVEEFISGDLDGLTNTSLSIILPPSSKVKSYPNGLFEDIKASQIPRVKTQADAFDTALHTNGIMGYAYLTTTPTSCSGFTHRQQEAYALFHKDAMYQAAKHSLYKHFKAEFHETAKYKEAWDEHRSFRDCKNYRSNIDWEG